MVVLLEILCVALLAIATARLAPQPWRGRILNLLKAWMTVRAFWLLAAHQFAVDPGQVEHLVSTGWIPEDAARVAGWRLIRAQLELTDAGTFWLFCSVAAGIKFVGILASMYRWIVLLRGQGIELPFRHIFGAFLTGRFIGTFLPSTAGLDGYTLYDAARFSGKTVEVAAAKALEKAIGLTGIFLSYLVALPAGIGMFYAIFGPEQGLQVALLGVAVCAAVVAGILLVLWFPGIIQWGIEHLPLPGKARLQGIVLRISHSAAAYRDKKRLVVLALALSFVVHFTTAAMYYFTALAITAKGAEFWPIVLASSIQILATVLSPITIAGEGIRELAQLVLLQNMIGPAAAIVSAALGFWAAEAPTLLGGIFWWTRRKGYRPTYCRVDGAQVDYETAAREAVSLETPEDTERRKAQGSANVPPYPARARRAAGLGLGTGILAGLVIGLGEAIVIGLGGFGTEAQVLWYGPLAYAGLLAGLGTAGGLALAALPMDRDEVDGWTPSLAGIGLLLPLGLAVTVFRLRRDVFLEQMPPLPVLLGLVAAAGAIALVLFSLGPRIFRSRFGRIVRPLPALFLLAAVAAGGAIGAGFAAADASEPTPPAAIPAELAERPNLILVMVDTLRADHLSCYGSALATPHLCSLVEEGGTLYNAYSHASWTKPATATLLTSLVPTSHGAMSKPAVLPEEVETVAEGLQARSYVTGGIVSNINLAESFGFSQGFDEYHYLGPDYLFGAAESSSKLVLYQIGRSVWFKLHRGLRFGDFYQDSAVVNGVAFDWLERHRDARFFLFLHYMDPHDPYFAHPYGGAAIARVSNQHPDASLADEMHQLYNQEIEYLDGNFGALLTKLRELGLYDETLIVLTADHGEEFHEHAGWWHGMTLYDEQIHVPLLVKWPQGSEHPTDARRHLVRSIDVAPTLLRAAGAGVPPAMQGLDLTVDRATRPEKDRMAFIEEDHEGNVLRGIRTLDWKLVEANEGNPRGLSALELYDLREDPQETRNLASELAQQASRLRAHAKAQAQLAADQAAGDGTAATLSAAEQEALRALGYIE